ncbi:MAG: hypothetical protein QW372_03315 [Nitrososphaerales archaeon]
MFKHCPGINSLVRPTIIIRNCPFCGEEVEFFEYETQQECSKCGKIVYREASESCILWCSYSEKCVDDLESKRVITKERAEELRKIAQQRMHKT